MKFKAGNLFLITLLICTSCMSIYKYSVDIQEPALIALPVSSKNVLILNNTVAQPDDYGISRTINWQPVYDNFSISIDSVIWKAINRMAIVLDESNFFNEVAVYLKPVREDAAGLSKAELFAKIQSEFSDEEKFEVMLVIDRLLFSVMVDVMANWSYQTRLINLKVFGLITCSMYSFDNDKPFSTFTISDSLLIKSLVFYEPINVFKEIPELALNILSLAIAEKAAQRFIPSWKTSERFFFTNINPRMRRATDYVFKNNWSEAETLWTDELGKKKKPVDKARIAINLALANEMQDNIEQAYQWALNSKEYLKKAGKKKDGFENKLTDVYIRVLEQRIINNRLLDLQWGKNE